MAEYVYRRYLYIDTDEIMAHATVMDGGEISDDVRTITRQSGGKIGAELGPKLIPFSLSFGLNADRASSRQFKIRQNAHVATDKVVNGIKKEKVSKEEDIKEGMVIECDAFLEKLRKVPEGEQASPLNWRERRLERKDPRIAYAREYSNHQDMLVEALGIKAGSINAVLILGLSPQWLLRPEEFSRRATIVGKVVGVKRSDETAQDFGDGTIDFERADNVSRELATRDGDHPKQEDSIGWWRRHFRKPSWHAHEVATSAAIPSEKPETPGQDISKAKIRIVPITIYK